MARDASYVTAGIHEGYAEDRRSGVDPGIDGDQGGVWVDGEGGATTDNRRMESSSRWRGINRGSEGATHNLSTSRCDGYGDRDY